MKTISTFPRNVVETPDMGIVMSDGCRLSARVWMPVDAIAHPVPAILEHLPYRKRDGTTARDSLTHPYFAGHGYACLRVDMRGNGDSEGLMEDEYSEQELQDACEVIAWAAAQPWCNGQVGMMGISWGGFNSLQVAAKQPPALKAIITLCSTDDRYADDIHYKGGLLLNENMGWAATMLSYSSRPPDPTLVGDKWRDIWLDRLDKDPFLVGTWLKHQHRDAYWKRGSVCEDFSAIKAATLAIGGWGDSYKNTVSRLVSGISAPTKGIVGPWVHKYPHFAVPNPAIGFLQEALRWWDKWLKQADTGVEHDPDMRLYVIDSEPPRDWYLSRPGRWVVESEWPSPTIVPQSYTLSSDGALGRDLRPIQQPIEIASPQSCGADGGEYCAIWLGPELPGDQRVDDAKSVCFDTAPLSEAFDIVGAPSLRLAISADRPVGMVAIRLCDVQPDGASTRITYGVLNLCHRDSHEFPRAIVPGERMDIRVQLDDIAYRVEPGNRIRVAISTTYWPLVWPSPEAVTLTLHGGNLDLPVRAETGDLSDEWRFPEPEGAAPWRIETIRPSAHVRDTKVDAEMGTTTLTIVDDFGETRDLDHGLAVGGVARETWSVSEHDPLSAEGSTHWTQTLSRDDWAVRTETFTQMRSSATHFYLTGRIEAYEGDVLVFERDFEDEIARDLI